LKNIPNYNPNISNQINNPTANINNMNNLSFNNYQRQMYENQNNKNFNSLPQHSYSFTNNDINNMNHKKIKKMANNSPMDPTNIANVPQMNLGNIYNLNYNGQNNKFMKNPNNNNMGININNKMSLSSQGPKNTIPNFNPNIADNLNLMNTQSQQMPPSLLNMNYNPLNNRNIYVPQNLRNVHMSNYINNNHIINQNTNLNNKVFNNNNTGFNHNNIGNNKKYQKQNNNNTYQTNNPLNNNNNMNTNNNNNQIFNASKSNKSNDNYNIQRSPKGTNNFSNKNNIHLNNTKANNNNNDQQQQKSYLLCLNLKLGNNQIETINIKSLDECKIILKELKERKKLNDTTQKIIEDKIYEAIQLTQRIYKLGLNKYTYKNLVEINNKIIQNQNRNLSKKMKKSNSSPKISNESLENEMVLSKDDIRKIETLNLSY
jgi:hypothetical protein